MVTQIQSKDVVRLKARMLCWSHGMQLVLRQASKGKHVGEYRLACKCWRGAAVPEQTTSEQPT